MGSRPPRVRQSDGPPARSHRAPDKGNRLRTALHRPGDKQDRAGRRIIYRRTECLHPAIQGCDVFQAALALRPGTLPGQGRGKGKGDLRSHLPTERQIPDAGRSPFGHSADEINPYRRECLVAEMPLVTGICLAK